MVYCIMDSCERTGLNKGKKRRRLNHPRQGLCIYGCIDRSEFNGRNEWKKSESRQGCVSDRRVDETWVRLKQNRPTRILRHKK